MSVEVRQNPATQVLARNTNQNALGDAFVLRPNQKELARVLRASSTHRIGNQLLYVGSGGLFLRDLAMLVSTALPRLKAPLYDSEYSRKDDDSPRKPD